MEIYNQGVLIVDDEDSIHLLLGEELEGAGFKKIYKAFSGIQCINILKEYGDEIVIILMDINMPEMDGISTVQHIMNYYNGKVGVIFHTAYQEFRQKLSKVGNENVLNLDYVIKSSSSEYLIKSIEKNIKIVLDKRKNILTASDANIIKEINLLREDIKTMNIHILEMSKKLPYFWVDVGKQIFITIILAAFVFSFMFTGLPDIIRDFFNKK